MDSGIKLCIGKVLGTHDIQERLLSSKCSFVFAKNNCWFLLGANVPISVMQYMKNGIYKLTSFGFVLNSLFHFAYLFVFFRVSGKSMVGCTCNPNIECRDKKLYLWDYIRDLFTIDYQE